jgi:hypothetical protein
MTNENGIGLAETMVAGFITILILLAISEGLSNINRFVRKLESTMDLLIIRITVVERVDCAQTIAASPTCTTGGGYVALKSAFGAYVVALNGTQIGKFLVRARCDVGGGIDVRAAKLTPAGMLAPDSIDFDFATPSPTWYHRDEVDKVLLYNWAHPKGRILSSVLGNDLRICKGYF